MEALDLFLQVKDHDEKDHDIPHPLVKESRMHLNIIGSRLHMGGNALTDVGCAHHGDGQAHGEQAVCILAENLSVKEVAPAAQDLTQDQAEADVIQKQIRICFFESAEYKYSNNGQNDTAVDRKTASPQIKNLKRVVLVVIPHEDHIIDAGAGDR